MGNRAKRVAVARRLKELGLGKLYSGNKTFARERLRGARLTKMLRQLQFEVGSLVNDCDMLNHRLVRWNIERYTHRRWQGHGRGWVAVIDSYAREDGRTSCGCGFIEPAKTREEIEGVFKRTFEAGVEHKGTWSEATRKRYEALQREEHVLDENGMILPAYV